MLNSNKTVPKTYNLRRSEIQTIEQIAEERGLSRSEIIRNAIHLYAITNQQLNERKRLAFQAEDGTLTKLEVLWPKAIEGRPTLDYVKEAMWRGTQPETRKYGIDYAYNIGVKSLEAANEG